MCSLYHHFTNMAKKQSISNYGQDPRLRAKLDINTLSKLFKCWPDMEYDISDCSQVSYTPLLFRNLKFCSLT
jgi:hypothetical protein